MKTGVANLPLHPGKAPRWLFERMVRLSDAICEAVVYEHSQEEFLRRLSNPFWFQAFACALGFDWHSSGTTTTACGALKVALSAERHGIVVAGGKGKTSKKAPGEIMGAPFEFGEGKRKELVYASRMAAKVDNSLVQDGYQLYQHCFVITEKGEWAVIQQGMGGSSVETDALRGRSLRRPSIGGFSQGMNNETARRYHWLSDRVTSFVEEPQAAICDDVRLEQVLDLTAEKSEEARKTSVDLVKDNPLHLRKYFTGQGTLGEFIGEKPPELHLPNHHAVLGMDISERGWKALINAYELQPGNYEELVALQGIGAKSLRALALISQLLYGSGMSWEDPARFSYAHGGKDGYPYPVDRANYDESVRFLRDAIEGAKLERREKYAAFKRLGEFI